MQVSATPVRRGVAVLMSSGGGAWLATGYFLPAFQAEDPTTPTEKQMAGPRGVGPRGADEIESPADSRFLPPPHGVESHSAVRLVTALRLPPAILCQPFRLKTRKRQQKARWLAPGLLTKSSHLQIPVFCHHLTNRKRGTFYFSVALP